MKHTESNRVGRLNTPAAIRRELARVYREARDNRLPVEQARVLNDLLSNIGQFIHGKGQRENIAHNEATV